MLKHLNNQSNEKFKKAVTLNYCLPFTLSSTTENQMERIRVCFS